MVHSMSYYLKLCQQQTYRSQVVNKFHQQLFNYVYLFFIICLSEVDPYCLPKREFQLSHS